MECRLRFRLFFIVVFLFFTKQVIAKCDEDYIDKIGGAINEKKLEIGGVTSLIPTSISAAIASLETGFGTSHAARRKNNHFGLSYREVPKTYKTFEDSVERYLQNLSKHTAYSVFRRLLEKGVSDTTLLIPALVRGYNQKDPSYVVKIKRIIDKCDLEKLDYI